MHRLRCFCLAALMAVLPMCGPPARTATLPPCGSDAGFADLLARHARAYGTESAVRASLPRSMQATRTRLDDGGSRTVEILLDARGVSTSSRLGPLEQAQGIDATGPWSLDPAGATLRLRGEETVAIQAEAWLLRREYLSTRFDTTCEPAVEAGRLVVRAHAHAPNAGYPVLFFDPETAALLRAELPLGGGQHGQRAIREYERWSAPNVATGVRFPLVWSDKSDDGAMVRIAVTSAVDGLHCRRDDGTGDAPVEISGGPCLAMHGPTRTSWPPSRRVRVPMTMVEGLLVLPARIGHRELWALLDSGANAAVVDREGAVASAFRPHGEETSGMAATQRVAFEIGMIDSIGIGDLVLSHNPAQRLSFPAFRELGTKRPELLLGWPLFAMAAVRIDYVRDEIIIAADAAGLVSPGASKVPLRVADGSGPLAEIDVEGERGWFLVDTGSTGDVDFAKAWSDRHGFPGARPTRQKQFHFGLGPEKTTATVFRLASATLGPIAMHGRNSFIHDRGADDRFAGAVGEGALSSCAAVIFDIPQRSLWFEPPCDRRGTEGLFSTE